MKEIRSVGRQNVVGEMTLWGSRERYGQGYQRTEKVGGLAEGYFLQWKGTV